MRINYISIFTDELIALEKIDGSKLKCIIQSKKNHLDEFEALSSELQDLHQIIVTVKTEGNKRLDFPIKIRDIHSIERTT